jgi:ankyrin repeat protein
MDIFSVIRLNDLEGVNQWLKTGPNINIPNIYGMTPINRASFYGHAEIVKLLLAQSGIDINKPNDDRWTPINHASYYGYTEIVKLLLAQPGIDFNKPDNHGRTPINHASYYGYTEIVKLLLAQPGIDFNKVDIYGKTPINCASNRGHTAIVRILEEYQKNPVKMRLFYLREYFPQIIEEYFILMVLYSDDYFICTDEGEIGRFFKIAVSLPQELQALIANLIIGSSHNVPRLSFVNEAIKKFLIKKLIFF